jgi:serine/threonine protein kinase
VEGEAVGAAGGVGVGVGVGAGAGVGGAGGGGGAERSEEELKTPEKFTKKENLGEGPRSRVEVWVDKETGDVFVAKTYTGSIDSEKFVKGARGLVGLDHPAVLKTLGFVPQSERGQASLLTAHTGGFGGHGTLEGLLRKVERLTMTHRAVLIVGIAEGLKYLHEKGLVHGNLKPSNVAIDGQGHPKLICNTGVFGGEKGEWTLEAPWAAPEYLSRGEVTSASDVWGLGLLTYQLITGKPAFEPGLKPWPLLEAVMGGVRPEVPEWLPDGVALLVRYAWDVDPGVRPKAGEFFEALSRNNFAIGEGVEVKEVRRYASRFMEGAQPGEWGDEAEVRANQEAREEVSVLKKEVSKLKAEVERSEMEEKRVGREVRGLREVLGQLLERAVLLENEVVRLREGGVRGEGGG